MILDGTLRPIDRIAADRPFCSCKHKKHGMNVQVIVDPQGRLMWASPVLAGAVHDVRAAREHGIIEALAEAGISCWADKGYQGAGGTVRLPYRGRRDSSDEPPNLPAWFSPPPPAPTAEHLHALVKDAATQARDFLRIGVPLKCAWVEDAVRLSSCIPHTCIPDIADRLGASTSRTSATESPQAALRHNART